MKVAQHTVVAESVFGRKLARATVGDADLVSVIKKFAAYPYTNCVYVNGYGYFSVREALAPLIAVNRYSMENNGARVFANV